MYHRCGPELYFIEIITDRSWGNYIIDAHVVNHVKLFGIMALRNSVFWSIFKASRLNKTTVNTNVCALRRQ